MSIQFLQLIVAVTKCCALSKLRRAVWLTISLHVFYSTTRVSNIVADMHGFISSRPSPLRALLCSPLFSKVAVSWSSPMNQLLRFSCGYTLTSFRQSSSLLFLARPLVRYCWRLWRWVASAALYFAWLAGFRAFSLRERKVSLHTALLSVKEKFLCVVVELWESWILYLIRLLYLHTPFCILRGAVLLCIEDMWALTDDARERLITTWSTKSPSTYRCQDDGKRFTSNSRMYVIYQCWWNREAFLLAPICRILSILIMKIRKCFSSQRPPIILLKEGTDTSQGKPQIISNINACEVVVDAVASTLGPRGMDKLIVDGHGM